MKVISIYARLDGGHECPYCRDAYDERGFCQSCHGCVLCCWSSIHCFMCDLPEILCECVSCEENVDPAETSHEGAA